MKNLTISLFTLLLIVGCVTTHTKAVEHINDFSEVVVSIDIFAHGTKVSSGSGVLIASTPRGNKHQVAVITAKHVIDNLPLGFQPNVVIDGLLYLPHQIYEHPTKDVAILVIETNKPVPIASIDYNPLVPLSEIYNVGFPLGMEFLVTAGILNYQIANGLGTIPEGLWLCSAPTYPGNSGGGLFYKASRKLIGLSIAVGTHPKRYDNVVVPHIHIFIPINILREWITEVNNERQKI